jgi:hypothetical protein
MEEKKENVTVNELKAQSLAFSNFNFAIFTYDFIYFFKNLEKDKAK